MAQYAVFHDGPFSDDDCEDLYYFGRVEAESAAAAIAVAKRRDAEPVETCIRPEVVEMISNCGDGSAFAAGEVGPDIEEWVIERQEGPAWPSTAKPGSGSL